MSSRKELLVTLSPRARQDFIDILRHTDQMWGEDQLLTYRDKIDAALQAIGRNTKIGHRCNDLPATHLAYLIGSHVIVYREQAVGVGVARILHQRMSLGKHV